jgi:tRNA wybutosine-synthesizing protein 4
MSIVGPSTVTSGSNVYLCGGVGSESDSTCLGQSIVRINVDEEGPPSPSLFTPWGFDCSTLPLMLGSSVTVHSDHLLVAGGGTTTFAAGSLWNETLHTINISQNFKGLDQILSHIELLEVPKINSAASGPDHDPSVAGEPPPMINIPRIRLGNAENFRTVLNRRKPVIIEGLDFGACLTEWTPEYLTAQVGPETEVSSGLHHYHMNPLTTPWRLSYTRASTIARDSTSTLRTSSM